MKIKFAVALISILALAVLPMACLSEVIEEVTVSFDAAGGTPEPSNKVLNKGDKLGDVPSPKKGTDAFIGWFNGYDLFDAETVVYNDIKLTAKWRAADSAETVRVTFSSDGGIPETTTIDVVAGKSIGPRFPIAPRKEGFRFDGWEDASGVPFTKDSAVSSNISVTAIWTAKPSFTVTLNVPATHRDRNPGVHDRKITVYEGDAISDWNAEAFPKEMLCANDPNTNQFYRFFRWTDDGTNNGLIYSDRTPITANVSITAVYGLNFHPKTFEVDLSTQGIQTPTGTGSIARTPQANDRVYNAEDKTFSFNVHAAPVFVWFSTPPELKTLMAQASVANETKFRWTIEYEFEDPSRDTDFCWWNFLIGNIRQGDNWNQTTVEDLPLSDINFGKFDDSLGARPGIGELHNVAATITNSQSSPEWVVVRAGRGTAFANEGGAYKVTFKSIKIHLVQ